MKNIGWKLSILSVLVLAMLPAQTFQGTLRGRVVDPNGSATATAQLTLTEIGRASCVLASYIRASYIQEI